MSTISQGLLITAVGMGLVFLMILALWGIMVLLVKLTNKPKAQDEAPLAEPSLIETEAVPANDTKAALAAAIAVAYALESQASTAGFASQQGAGASNENAWWTAGKTQQLYSNTIRGRNR